MGEILVGPRGTRELPPVDDPEFDAKLDEAINLSGTYGYREHARDAALDWRDTHLWDAYRKMHPKLAALTKQAFGEQAPLVLTSPATVQRQKGTMAHNEGQFIGVESTDSSPLTHSLRLDWDAQKGPHYNLVVGKGSDRLKACFRFAAPAGVNGQQWIEKMMKKWSR